MTSAFSPFPSNLSDRILCYYVNTSSHIQKARITTIPNWLFERLIFPKQRLFFEALPNAFLEIHACSMLGETLLKHIPCLQLRVSENTRFSTTISQASAASMQTAVVEEQTIGRKNDNNPD